MTRISLALATVLLLVFIFWIVSALTGCGYPMSKAKSQFAKASVAYPELPADYCARTYPPQIKSDTTFTSDSALYQQTIDELQGDLSNSNQTVDSLIKQLGVGDTACRKYLAIIIDLQKKIMALKQKVITLPPIVNTFHTKETVVNTAALDLCSINRDKAIGLLEKKTAEYDKWRAIAKKKVLHNVRDGLGYCFGIIRDAEKKTY